MIDAYFLSHNGLGDNIISISAVNYLSKFYKNVYFLCKDIYIHHINYIFKNTNIIPIAFDSKNEFRCCYQIIIDKYQISDIFICGCHKSYLKSKITNEILLNYTQDDNNIIFPKQYTFFRDFYHDINLDLQIFKNYFYINTCNETKKLYDDISNYKIIFLHTESSYVTINLDDKVKEFIDKDDYLIINVNKNMYSLNNLEKYNIANKYIKLKTIIHYYFIIQNATDIFVVNSSISCIIIGLHYNNLLKTKNVNIYTRDTLELLDLH